MNNNRVIYYDILNVFAILGVIMLHSSQGIREFEGVITPHFLISAAVHSFAIWSVCIFYMLSGCTIIGRIWPGKNQNELYIFFHKIARKTLFPFIVWSLIYWLLYSRTTIVPEFLTLLLNGHFTIYMWFFIPLFGIYLSLPFMEGAIISAKEKELRYFLIVCFLFAILLPYFFSVLNIKVPNLFPIATDFLYLPILGYYLKEYEIKKKFLQYIYLSGFFRGGGQSSSLAKYMEV